MFIIAALYHFTRFTDPAALQAPLIALGRAEQVRGTLLLAQEGINGTIAGPRAGIDAMLSHIRALPGCAEIEHKESQSETPPFPRLKVRIKREIVTMGQPDVNTQHVSGQRVAAADWNALISAPDVVVIDTRNDYETAIGSFSGAVVPGTSSFRDFPNWWQQNAARFEGKRIAMFCTGGIRCEKSTNYLMSQGVDQVYHLNGGILKYLEDVPEAESLWDGQCFVFDGRVSVGHRLIPGDYDTCHACRRPLASGDKLMPEYEAGVSCPRCIGETTETDRARFRERQKQIALAASRGQRHLGQDGT